MFGTLGGQELIVILIVALLVFGPRKLPEIGKSIGRMMHEFRRASNDFKRTIEDEVQAEQSAAAAPAAAEQPAPAAPPETIAKSAPEEPR